mgnify:CR=1 FL=1
MGALHTTTEAMKTLICFEDPVAAILTRFYSLRTLQICGLIVAAVGIALSGFAASQIHVIILFGLVAGE